MQIYKYRTVVSHACFALLCFALLCFANWRPQQNKTTPRRQSQRQLSFGKGATQCKYISIQLSSVTLALLCFALLCFASRIGGHSKAKQNPIVTHNENFLQVKDNNADPKLSLGKGQQRRSKKIESYTPVVSHSDSFLLVQGWHQVCFR